MFVLPPLKKDALRSLLSQSRLPAAPTPSTAELRSARQWAIAANLLNEQGLTPEGTLVIGKDPYLEATVTDWLIHFHVSSGDRSLWKYFVYEFLSEHSEFSQVELSESCIHVFQSESPETLRKNAQLILKTYAEKGALARSQFLTPVGKNYSIGHPDLSNPYTVGYLLAKVWERDFQKQPAVLVDAIVDAEKGLTSVLGINKEQLRQQLDVLARHGVIEQRSAKPHLSDTRPPIKTEVELSYQVYRCWETSIELLEKAYEQDMATPNRPLIQALGSLLDDDEDVPDFSKFLEWASGLISLEGGSNTIIRLAS